MQGKPEGTFSTLISSQTNLTRINPKSSQQLRGSKQSSCRLLRYSSGWCTWGILNGNYTCITDNFSVNCGYYEQVVPQVMCLQKFENFTVVREIQVNQGGIQAKSWFLIAQYHWTLEVFGIKEHEYSCPRMHSNLQHKT